ncbi:uncharacterized protein [Nicotiana tomentosiformis]|uniref:uncharacterized protein n=1 Tax=Nicotiana tomentosiformis TaxID=4098 RepID=UPI00388CD0C2
MTNPSENPSSSPQETTSIPTITPSTTPTSKKRVKMLAHKVVMGRAQIKKINEKFKARKEEEPQKSDESFKSSTEGEETVSSKTEHVSSGPKVTHETISEVAANLENRVKKESKGVRSAVRGKGKRVADSSPTPVRLTKDTGAMVVWEEKSGGEDESVQKIGGNEPGSSVEETLADLLKKVSQSYNPKKKRTSKAKISGTARANKKRKVAPSDSAENPPTRGRATRSQRKQNEADLQKALEESKRKAVAKGKKKMAEPVEAVDIDEMDLVHKDKHVIEEVEVQTPKPKKAKTSTKKSISKSKSAEPSTLA